MPTWTPLTSAMYGLRGLGPRASDTITTSQALAVGDLINIAATWDSHSGAAQGVAFTDDLGNTYTAASPRTAEASGQFTQTYKCIVTVAGTPTITWTITGSGTHDSDLVLINVDPFTGSDASSTLDGSQSNAPTAFSAGTDTLSSGTFATTIDGDLIYTCCFDSQSGTDEEVIGTGFTSLSFNNSTGFGFRSSYKVQSTHSSTTEGLWSSVQADQFQVAAHAITPATGAGNSVTPGVGALIFAGLAPTVAVSDNKNIATGVGALTFTGFAPLVSVGNVRAPGTGVLTFNGFAPTATATANQFANPGVGQITFNGFVPLISVGNVRAPGTGVLTFNGFAPTVAATNNQVITPGTGVLTLTGSAPTVTAPNNQNVLAGVGTLTFNGLAPLVSVGNVRAPGTGVLTFNGLAPTVFASDRKTALPGVGLLTFVGFAPTIVATDPRVVLPGCGQLVYAGFPPHVVSAGLVPPVYPAAQFTLNDIQAYFTIDRIEANFTSDDAQAYYRPDVN